MDLNVLAKQTPGFSGADLANLVNESAILTARANKKRISMDEFNESVDRVIAGPERKSRVISPREKEIIAYHEAGHALVSHLLPNADAVYEIWMRNSFIYLLILVAVIAIVVSFFRPPSNTQSQDLSQVIAEARNGQVESIEAQGDSLTVHLKNDSTNLQVA